MFRTDFDPFAPKKEHKVESKSTLDVIIDPEGFLSC
jgi:hypothetical protein